MGVMGIKHWSSHCTLNCLTHWNVSPVGHEHSLNNCADEFHLTVDTQAKTNQGIIGKYCFLLKVFLLFFFFWDSLAMHSDWLWIQVFLPQSPAFWDHRWDNQTLVFSCARTWGFVRKRGWGWSWVSSVVLSFIETGVTLRLCYTDSHHVAEVL